ncbi:MAG: hypothetical protein BJ554DRAFT_6007 [Olpidium bornovanus]|uniref:Uncharacterized protein n=1 Tax=Olpidium bornovanus TaxID=278681 RepID=A0A8H7ZYV0_9FUNG|nr:MAG: hypothetical protein BJ554DRAFT_6007 [Olpidium bornovanus]
MISATRLTIMFTFLFEREKKRDDRETTRNNDGIPCLPTEQPGQTKLKPSGHIPIGVAYATMLTVSRFPPSTQIGYGRTPTGVEEGICYISASFSPSGISVRITLDTHPKKLVPICFEKSPSQLVSWLPGCLAVIDIDRLPRA